MVIVESSGEWRRLCLAPGSPYGEEARTGADVCAECPTGRFVLTQPTAHRAWRRRNLEAGGLNESSASAAASTGRRWC